MFAYIPCVTQPSSNEGAKCPVCGNEVTFIAPDADLARRFDGMTEAARNEHDEHCAEYHPNEPVWNTFPKRSNVKIISVEGFIQYTLDLAAETLDWNPVRATSWEHIKSHLYLRLAVARSLTADPGNVFGNMPGNESNADKQLMLDKKNWIKNSTKTFLTSLMDIVWNSDEPKGWEKLSLQKLENLIQICFRQDGAYASCGLIDNTRIPPVPRWPDDMDEIEVSSLRRKGRKRMKGWQIRQEKKRRSRKNKGLHQECIQMYEPRESNKENVDGPPLGVGDIILCKPGIRHSLASSVVKQGVVVSAAPRRCVITVHPFGVFGSNEDIQRQKLVKREDDRQDSNVYMGTDLIPLPDNEPWRKVADFRLIEGQLEHPGSLATQVASIVENFQREEREAFQAFMSNSQA